MASFPGSIFSRRAVADRAGVVYDAAKTKVFYAKDHNDFGKEIVAIENALGVDFPFNWPMEITGTLTRDSDDDPTYVMKIAGVDWTAKLTLGMRIKWTQNGTVRYGIITKLSFSTHTYITIYGGTDYDMLNSTTYPITNCFVSNAKAPHGFPLNPDKWTIETADTGNRSQANPVAGTWYNITELNTSLPIGSWKVSVLGDLAGVNATNAFDVYVTLSTANNSATDAEMTSMWYQDNTGTFVNSFYREKIITVTSKTPYYVNIKTPTANATSIALRGDLATSVFRIVCAYL